MSGWVALLAFAYAVTAALVLARYVRNMRARAEPIDWPVSAAMAALWPLWAVFILAFD